MLTRHTSVTSVTKYLEPNPRLEGTQAEIADVMHEVVGDIFALIPDDSAELTAGFRKLLEAKDCFVRASLDI
jgi:hypothetical protein